MFIVKAGQTRQEMNNLSSEGLRVLETAAKLQKLFGLF